jgi:beta-lactamase regulating signal transducer with metallopeptidase domain
MNLLPSSLHAFADAMSAALVASIWQGVLLITCVAVCLRVVRGLTAAVRSAIWTCALVLVIALPLFALLPTHVAAVSQGAVHVRETWSFAILGAWMLLSLVRGVVLVRSGLALRRIATNAVPVVVEGVVAELLGGAARRVELCTSVAIKRPCLVGFLRPRILLPEALLPALSMAELEQVVLHEMEHLRRRDDWINLLQQASMVLCPLNPAVVWVDRRLTVERELACDDGVLRATGARKAYAACLTRIAEHALFSRGVSLALALVGRRGNGSEISRRVHRILRSPERAMSGLQLRLTMGLLVAAAIVSVGMIARSPKLVSFAPTPSASMASAVTIPMQTAARLNSTAAFRPSAMRPTLLKALMPAPTRQTAMPRNVRGLAHRAMGRDRLRRNESAERASQMVLTEWNARTQTARPTMTLLQDSQAAYAAIRFGDGWLIVQL